MVAHIPDSQKKLISNLLSRHNGIAFADDHDNPLTLHWLANAAPILRKAGMEDFYLEMFLTSHKAEIDKFNQTGILDPELVAWLDEEWRYPPRKTDDYITAMHALRDAGIKLKGVNTQYLNVKPVDTANHYWTKQISAAPSGKYGVLGGRLHMKHANRHADDAIADFTPGLDAMLNVPCLYFSNRQITESAYAVIPDEDASYQIYIGKPMARSMSATSAHR